ncbi:MAG: periplasmic glucan biosynthesis protein, partial [Geminicoccaceae bacterium]|nr:periplasmic glucan biosynthesis protein [Geminicoccaceae bacterium]
FSVLLAPVLMVEHSRAVLGILSGRGVTWSAQQRDGERESWGAVAASFGGITALGVLWAAAAYLVAPDLLLWLSPVFAGLAAAIPLAALSSRPDLGAAARRRGWFLTPEECAPPVELAELAVGPLDAQRGGDAPASPGAPTKWPRWTADSTGRVLHG